MPIKNAAFRIQFSMLLNSICHFPIFHTQQINFKSFCSSKCLCVLCFFFHILLDNIWKKIRLQQSLITVRMEDSCKTEEQVGHVWWEYSLFVPPFCSCSKKNFFFQQMVDIVSLQKMVLYWIHLRSINMSSALIFHLQKTFPMSIFDFQVHLCTGGNPPNMLPHNCKTHTFLSLNQAFTRAWPPLGLSLFRSCKGPPGDPNKSSFNVRAKVKLFLLGGWFCPCSFFYLVPKLFFFFFFHLRISLSMPTLCSGNY